MDRHTICFVTSGNLSASRSRWLKPIEGAWPGATPFSATGLGMDQLIATLESRATDRGAAPLTAAVVVLGPSEAARTIDRLIEAFASANVPALCLLQDPAPWKPFQRHGVLFEAWDTPAPILSAMLFALAERQSAVDLLSREIVLSQRCQGGIRSEMDRIHEELHLAAAIQREFTSAPLPQVDGLEMGVLFRPVNFVSGDIYNVRPLGDGKAAFFLADAVGHGVPAALLTMVLTSSLTTTEVRAGALRVLEPSEVLSRLNDRLCESCLGSGRFATALYGVIDVNSREVKLAGAGHPWPLVVSQGGSAREVRTEGPLLGVFPGADFTQATVELGQGESLLLYTDGFESIFPERGGEGDDPARDWLGREYLGDISRLVGEAGEGDIMKALGQLGHLLDEQSGSLHQGDDITALVIAPTRAAGAVVKKKAA